MVFNKHVRLVVAAELGAALQRGFLDGIDQAAVPPQLLYVLANGEQLRDAVENGAWPAPDVRFAGLAALDAYALPLLDAFIDERRSREPGTPQCRFGDELANGLHPVGSHFERYVVRMFDGVGAALSHGEGRGPYAVGLRTPDLDVEDPSTSRSAGRRGFTLLGAIYDAATQRAVMDAIFTFFESFYVHACERFGQQPAQQVLDSCWDGFRQAVGMVLPRFRPPQLCAEREWIACARWQAPTRFQLAGNLMVPALSLRARAPAAGRLPIGHVLLDTGLPQPLAANSLREFFRFHKLHARVTVAR
ncbi:hypothetical protein ACI48D_20200 [Massilia sp. LXY-6]|uniref:hypothetical protein n=1 Tax=Massilia sp. LXY-6 TaxID=3379823 RepID=UPI003EE130D0